MLCHEPARSVRLLRFASPEGFHSRRPLFETSIRHRVCRMAVPLKNASWGRQRSVKIAWVTPLPADRAAPARCWLVSTSSGFFRTSMRELIKEGISTMPKSDAVQNQGDGSAVQPSSASSVNAGDTRLRRRLSRIFQRDSGLSGFFRERALGPGTPGSSHRRSCQSPRIQRRRRLTSALYRDGYSSSNCTSLISPERA